MKNMKAIITDERGNTITIDHGQLSNMIINNESIQELFTPCAECGAITWNKYIVTIDHYLLMCQDCAVDYPE